MSVLEEVLHSAQQMVDMAKSSYPPGWHSEATNIIKQAAAELAAKNAKIETAIKALRAVIHDRPTAHSDAVWQQVLAALAKLESE
jgi:flagellar biosynthesis/type III secretory pathway protein FliH